MQILFLRQARLTKVDLIVHHSRNQMQPMSLHAVVDSLDRGWINIHNFSLINDDGCLSNALRKNHLGSFNHRSTHNQLLTLLEIDANPRPNVDVGKLQTCSLTKNIRRGKPLPNRSRTQLREIREIDRTVQTRQTLQKDRGTREICDPLLIYGG